MDKIVCVGKNYIEHAKELGDAVPAKPVLFLKPPSILRQVSSETSLDLFLPVDRGAVHHECEIVIQLKQGGFRMTEAEASKAMGAVSVGLDMTLRDQQMVLKKAGNPWTVSKVFTDSAVIGPWMPVEKFSDWPTTTFSLKVNGILKQEGVASQMTLNPRQCIAYISEHFPLCAGDSIFTGTPKGVGPVEPGDAAVLKFGPIEFSVLWHALKP